MGTGDVLRVLRRHWWFIAIATILGAALGVAWAATRTPEYTAKADVFITVTSGQTTGELAQGSSFSQQQARNFAAVATREIVLAPVIEELELDASVAQLRQRLNVTVPLGTSLVSLQVTHPDPALSARIANSAATQLAAAVSNLAPKVNDLDVAPVRAQLVEAATVPDSPSSPDILMLAVLGMLAGLVAGVAYQILSELIVARVSSTDQLEAVTGSAVLGMVGRSPRHSAQAVAVTAAPLSPRAEEIRHLRTALKFLTGGPHRAFVITSSISGEGKSTVAANLAAAFAAENVATCLVECDLRRPSLEKMLDLVGGPGLTDVIVGDVTVDDALQPWGHDGLQVLLSGTIPPNPSELLGSPRGAATLSLLNSRFDVVVLDTPPITAVTDASILGRQFGGVVLVTGAGRVRAAELRAAKDALAVADVPVLGAVLNLSRESAAHRPYAYANSETLARQVSRTWRDSLGNHRLKAALKAASVALLAAVVGGAGWLLAGRAQASTPSISPPPVTQTPGSPERPVAAFIGDSLVQGVGGKGVRWTTLTAEAKGWSEVNLGRGGTGFVTTAGPEGCGLKTCPSFPEMAPDAIEAQPDIVIISGGQNDGRADVADASLTLFSTLREALPDARIIVTSPPWRASATPAFLTSMGETLKRNAKTAGIEYLDIGNPLRGRTELFTDDGVHPNADGYRELAKVITRLIRDE